MAWEKRGNRTYYYRKVRANGHVRSQYCGCGEVASLFEEMVCDDPVGRQIARDQRQSEKDAEAEIANALDALDGDVGNLLRLHLRAIGWHTHKGEWRRRRR
jgi:hypothetical protein